ncbi:glycosyltransferase [Clostridium botulinum]|nr:glycosyltransferase [Clostridium botulinum]
MASIDKYKFKFSIIIAIYNIEEYLEEAIESIINQENIIFEKDVQLILVNDGSVDESGSICEKYRDMYPKNIFYKVKENGGVSSARNLGLQLATGKYVNFLDGDDKFENNVLASVSIFFEKYEEFIDVVAIGMKFFEGANHNHSLNYKFKKTKIVNILEEYDYIQLSSSSAFIKNSALKGKCFNEQLHYLEDAYLMTQIILEKKVYGVISDTTYFCRKRKSNTSATQNLTTSKEWYLPTLLKFHLSILEYGKLQLGYVPKYIQYLVMYDLQWRIKESTIKPGILTISEKKQYIEYISKIIKQIDDIIIKQQKALWAEHRLYCFKLKYGFENNLEKIITNDSIKVQYRDELLYSAATSMITIEFMNINNDSLKIEGFIPDMLLFDMNDINIKIKTDEEEYPGKWDERGVQKSFSLNTVIMKKQYFIIDIPLTKILDKSFEISLEIEGVEIKNKYRFGKYLRLFKDIDGSYFEDAGFTIKYQNGKFLIKKTKPITALVNEISFIYKLSKVTKKQALARIGSYIIKKLNRKSIWVFMDRIDRADDNAEALFKYVQDKHKVKSYFILGRQAEDYTRLSKIGKVIPYKSIKQKLVLLLADYVISSHVEHYLREPFQGKGKYLKNLCDFKFIFLQHGITKDNMSNLFNRHNKNIDLFITSGIQEYNSIFKYDYFYNENQVKLTGFPRHDFLVNNPKRQIAIMPTWRKNLASKLDTETGKRLYNENFKITEYFKLYNQIINESQIIDLCKKYNYKVIFLPHPNMMQQLEDFDKSDYVDIVEENINYNKVLCESDCLITDYSSLSFEFGYMKKPVIYFQFDYDEVFNEGSHSYEKGYYDYETMGFGPVAYKYENLLEDIKNMIINECNLDSCYVERVNKFFAYIDKNNCKRVFEEINKL